MTTYNVEVRKTKANGKCRICKKNILKGEIVAKANITDYYKDNSMMTHSDCILKLIINSIIKIQEEDLKEKNKKFRDIKEMLK